MFDHFDRSQDQAALFAQRRERVFMLLAGLFWGSLVMLNILGTSRFINLSSWFGLSESSSIQFILAVGVLPYPITFLCTDFISELYGRKRANFVVWIGLLLNIWVLFILWLGGVLNPPEFAKLPLQDVVQAQNEIPREYAFYYIRHLTFGATIASMIAYLCAQFVDVHIFHYLKERTKGKKLWLRNNGSTLVSQLVDTSAVILITFLYTDALPIDSRQATMPQLLTLIASGYLFKLVIALLDTIPFYIGTKYLKKYLGLVD
jgi:queuosine precursor transporter